MYMSTQEIADDQGLEMAALQSGAKDKTMVLSLMIEMRQLIAPFGQNSRVANCRCLAIRNQVLLCRTIPVAVYNRRCGPRSQWCRGANDPDIRFTRLTQSFPCRWKDSYSHKSFVGQEPVSIRDRDEPNPNLFRGALFNLMDIQVLSTP